MSCVTNPLKDRPSACPGAADAYGARKAYTASPVGLLYRSDGGTNSVSSVSDVFDANGNMSELLTATGEIAAHYVEAERKSDHRRKHDPYGNTLVATGVLACDNKFRFSTKPVEENTGLVLYEFRIYLPDLGGFGSKDPSQEGGGISVYSFVANNPMCAVDFLGLRIEWVDPGQGEEKTWYATYTLDMYGDIIRAVVLGMAYPTYRCDAKSTPTSLGSSCCEITIDAFGYAEFWWSTHPVHGSSFSHERHHVDDWKSLFLAAKRDVASYDGQVMPCPRADCIAYTLIPSVFAFQYRVYALKSARYDCAEGNTGRCSEIPGLEAAVNSARQRLLEIREECSQ